MATTAGDENHLFIDAQLEKTQQRYIERKTNDEEEKSQPL